MSRRILPAPPALRQLAIVGLGSMLATAAFAAEPNFPITPQQRATAQKAAETGVPLSELLPNAPDIYTVKQRDTLWGISGLYLKSPWRWPELWGTNLEQVKNPHLIFPGQVLFLDKSNGKARLRMGAPVGGAGDASLSPKVRSKDIALDGIASIPFNLIEPFLNEGDPRPTARRRAASSPRRKPRAAGGDTASAAKSARSASTAFPRAAPASGPDHRGARLPGDLRRRVEYTVQGETRTNAEGKAEIIPVTFTITSIREAGVGVLPPVPARSTPTTRQPLGPIAGQIVSIYGAGLTAGQNQIVALNRGAVDGIERGHVLALFRDGKVVVDPTEKGRTKIKLPDERHGILFVFRVFSRMSYALILSVKDPVSPGDRFTQP
jgi:hypothetical protein